VRRQKPAGCLEVRSTWRLRLIRLLARQLTDKYQQYRDTPPDGPVLAIDITQTRLWSAT
jgi:hypothetical protein